MRKYLWLDIETTGIDSVVNDPIEIAFIVETDELIEKVFYSQPISWNISNEALAVNKYTMERLKTLPPHEQAYREVKEFLCQYVDPYDPYDKFVCCGYGVRFDMHFLDRWFKKHGDEYFFSLVDSHSNICVLEMIRYLTARGELMLRSNKLKTVAEHFGLVFKEHDAFEDIRTTREIFKRIEK